MSRFITLCAALLLNLSLQGQQTDCISGQVVDALSGQPLPGTSVTAENGTGTSAGISGTYSLCGIGKNNVSMSFSYVGYEPYSQTVRSGEKLFIRLFPTVSSLDEVVVTATRTGSRIANTPVRINTLNSGLIETLPVHSLDEILKLAPGINYSRSMGIFSTKATVTMRGMSAKEQGRVLILVDGIPMNKSDGGGFDWNMIDPSMVENIEITKGPGSAVYGGNAMGGIINIRTRKPDQPFFLRAGFDFGTYGTLGSRAVAGGNLPVKKEGHNWYYTANATIRHSAGYITQPDYEVQANPYIVKSYLKEAGAGFRTRYTIGNRHSLGASLTFYDDNRGTGEKVYQPAGNTTDHDSYGITLDYRGVAGKFNLMSSVYFLNEDYKKVNEYLKDDYTWYEVLSTRRDYGFISSLSRSFGTSHSLTAGIDYRNGSVDAYDKYYTSTDIIYNAGNMGTWSAFLQDEAGFFSNRLRILAGLRFDRARFYNGVFFVEAPTAETIFMDIYQDRDLPTHVSTAISPRFSVHYRFNDNTRVYAGYSRGFRPAVLDDMCRSGRIKGGFKVATPGLKPEYLNNYEAGADLQPFERGLLKSLKIETSAFWSSGSDFQYYVTNGQSIDMGFGERPILIRANISKAEIKGAELLFQLEPIRNISVYATYAYADAEIIDYQKISSNDTIDLSGKKMTDVPNHLITAGVSCKTRFVNTSATYRYTGAMYINDQNTTDEILLSDRYPAFSTVDLRFWRSFKNRLNVHLNIQNLFDVMFYDSKYNRGPGRFIVAGVEVVI